MVADNPFGGILLIGTREKRPQREEMGVYNIREVSLPEVEQVADYADTFAVVVPFIALGDKVTVSGTIRRAEVVSAITGPEVEVAYENHAFTSLSVS
jgi:hypothetical protein